MQKQLLPGKRSNSGKDNISEVKTVSPESFLVVQWLGLPASIAEGTRLIPALETNILQAAKASAPYSLCSETKSSHLNEIPADHN